MGRAFEEYADVIYNYCFRRCADWSTAEDLTSVVFLEAWRHRERLVVSQGSLLPWLYGIATNVCRNQLRSQRRYRRALARADLRDLSADHAEDIASRVDDERTMAQVLVRVDELALGDRDVLALVVWEGLGYADVAAALGIPVGTVKSRMSRIRRQLRLSSAFTNTRRSDE